MAGPAPYNRCLRLNDATHEPYSAAYTAAAFLIPSPAFLIPSPAGIACQSLNSPPHLVLRQHPRHDRGLAALRHKVEPRLRAGAIGGDRSAPKGPLRGVARARKLRAVGSAPASAW